MVTGITAYKRRSQMNNITVYVGMDVHKESFTLCAYTLEKEKGSYSRRTPADYKEVLKYLEFLRTVYGNDTIFVCGYEAGCLGYTLYHQLTDHHVDCVILAPTTMLEQRGKKRIKTDKRDAEIIGRCLAQHNYSPVHVPTASDEEVKEFLRMRDDHKLALKKVKQQILAFCLRHNYRYDGNSHWTAAHINWLKSLTPEALYKEILDEYLLTYTTLSDKLERLDKRIEELAAKDEYKEAVRKLCCFIGVKTHTALSVIVEVGDFKRFASAEKFASYIGLVPGEDSSGDSQTRLGITKAGNRHVRMLLTEASQCYSRGQIGYKSKALKARQDGNTPQVIAYADKANERLRRRYYKMVLSKCKKHNVAKTAIARELACFMWGMMTDNIA
jgi:transposase